MGLAIAVTSLTVTAQNATFEKIASKHDQVKYMYISKAMLNSIGDLDGLANINISNTAKELDSVEIMMVEDEGLIEQVGQEMVSYLSTMEMFVSSQNAGQLMKIYGKRHNDGLSELLMLTLNTPAPLSAVLITGALGPEVIKNIAEFNQRENNQN